MSGLQITTAPTQEPLSLQEVKEYLRVEDSTDERILRPFIETARRLCEEHTGRSLMTQTHSFFVDAYDELADPLFEGFRTGPYLNYYKDHIVLPTSPVVSVSSVSTFNDDDTETTMAASRYYVDNVREPARVVLRRGETFPTALRVANAIKIVYVAGYTSAFSVPEPIRMGMLQHIAYLYEHRGDMYEAQAPMPPIVKKLYAPYVIHKGIGSSSFLAVG
tara:strand:- start:9729 stop:10385 length:657 start_codon:yes stop_codon:yes gene_type:complete